MEGESSVWIRDFFTLVLNDDQLSLSDETIDTLRNYVVNFNFVDRRV
eukprot:COSAG01_NODE_68170_length_265_cov_0.469880_1_plen_46_part_01